MRKNLNTHRVVTFLKREELEFLDKLKKDVMFSTGMRISRSHILQSLAELLARTNMNAAGIRDDQELKAKMAQAIAIINQEGPKNDL